MLFCNGNHPGLIGQLDSPSEGTVVCLRGCLVEEFFDELERICTERIELSPNGPNVAINVPAGQWHRVYAKESGTVLMESKNGKWEPLTDADILS